MMKHCTNEDCPALFCALQMIAKNSTDGNVHHRYELFNDPDASDLTTKVGGKQVGFRCDGYRRGMIA